MGRYRRFEVNDMMPMVFCSKRQCFSLNWWFYIGFDFLQLVHQSAVENDKKGQANKEKLIDGCGAS